MGLVDRVEAIERLSGESVGHLATVRPDGTPHVVVATFASAGDLIVTAVDQKPKKTRRLQRLINIEANRNVSFLVDHYESDWDRLWWVRVDGVAAIHYRDSVWIDAVEALAVKYLQYRATPPHGPVIAITPDRVSSWSSTL